MVRRVHACHICYAYSLLHYWLWFPPMHTVPEISIVFYKPRLEKPGSTSNISLPLLEITSPWGIAPPPKAEQIRIWEEGWNSVEGETVLMGTQKEPCFLSYSNKNKNKSTLESSFSALEGQHETNPHLTPKFAAKYINTKFIFLSLLVFSTAKRLLDASCSILQTTSIFHIA